MKKKLVILFFAASVSAVAFAQSVADGLLLIRGGAFKNSKSNYHEKAVVVADFYIGRCEVTQREWMKVMGNNPSKFQGDNLPVETVSWYDCIEYCNRRSSKEGLKPYYTIDRKNRDTNNQTDIDDVKWTVTINTGANGYRLPTEMEWEYAASGAYMSMNFTYSGSDDVAKVAWYWVNSGDKKLTGFWSWPMIEQNNNRTKSVGGLAPNELGIHDMSGNVREWCWDWFGELDSQGHGPKGSQNETGRVWKGGGWIGGDFCCAIAFRANFEASGKGPDQGLRICRSK